MDVPFVDVVSTMSDPTLPLTVTEYEVRQLIYLQLRGHDSHIWSNLVMRMLTSVVVINRSGEILLQMRACTTICFHILQWTTWGDMPTPTCWSQEVCNSAHCDFL